MSRDFDGSTDRLDWASIDNLSGDALTISAWVYLDINDANQYVICMHDSGDAQYGIVFNIVTSNIDFIRHGTTDYIWAHNTGTALGTGSWIHVLVTNNGGVATGDTLFYINGNTILQTFTNGSGAETAHTGSWSLGGRIYSDTRNFNGRMAEVGIWDRVVSAGEIAGLAAGATPDSYPTNLKFYYGAHTDTATAKVGGAAATDDGTSYDASHPAIDYITVLAGGMTPTGDLQQDYVPAGEETLMTLTGGMTPSGTATKSIAHTFNDSELVPIGPPKYVLSIAESLAGGITPTGTVTYIEAFIVTLVGELTSSGTVTWALNLVRTLSGGMTPTGAVLKSISTALAGGVTPTGALLKAFIRTMEGAITPAGTMAKSLLHNMIGEITPGGTLLKDLYSILTGGLTPSGVLSSQKFIIRAFAGVLSFAGALASIFAPVTGGGTPRGRAAGLSAILKRLPFTGVNSKLKYTGVLKRGKYPKIR